LDVQAKGLPYTRLHEFQFLRLHVNTQVTRHDSLSRVILKAQFGEGHAYQVGVNMGGKIKDRAARDMRSVFPPNVHRAKQDDSKSPRALLNSHYVILRYS